VWDLRANAALWGDNRRSFRHEAAMTCLIRQADTEDLPLLPEIERAASQLFKTIPELAFVADHAIMSLRDHIGMLKDGVTFVAQSLEGPHAGEVVGFICARQIGTTLHIHEMSVNPTSQGQGIGSALMAAMLDDAISARCTLATLTTFIDVPWNQGFYRRLGFVTLETSDLDARLRAILAAEVAAGLPAQRRCAMSIKLA
jgi:ribosomal protein S18 acetylase RimI-like enzyme